MVTKKRRRPQLARAGAQRRLVRRRRREARRRRLRVLLTVLAVLLAVTALVVWILTRPPGEMRGNEAGAVQGFDYDGPSVALSSAPSRSPSSSEVGP